MSYTLLAAFLLLYVGFPALAWMHMVAYYRKHPGTEAALGEADEEQTRRETWRLRNQVMPL